MSREGCALIWAYLSARRQRVKLSGHVSDWLPLLKGIPQGSIMGPIAFNLFMNDIFATFMKASLYNYADDNTIVAFHPNRQEVIETLTTESESAIEWFRVNMMEANPSKFHAIMLNDTAERATFSIDNANITTEQHVKLLGVNIDEKINFHHHVSVLCRKTGAQLKVLQRLSHYLDESSRLQVFRCFILSHFTYCALVWHFCGAVNCAKLERIQFRALKFVFNDFRSSYSELLDRAGLPTLELSRKRSILVEVFKALHKISPPFMWDLFSYKKVPYNLRGANHQVFLKQCRTKAYGLNSLSYYGAKLWNSLPEAMRDCEDLKSFEIGLQKWTPL